MDQFHLPFMRRCLDLAEAGLGRVAPNPLVGSVITRNGRIIGEGYHRSYGGPHAEVHAIRSVENPDWLKESTLYVNLEPCSHHGKTPPCADLIVRMGIPEVVIGTIDPFALVAGKGIEKLKNAGCKFTVGLLEEECRELNRRFFTFHQKKRPFIVLKWAQTSDGFVDRLRTDSNFGKPTWISNEMTRIAVHKQRAVEQAILVGTETIIKDNPSLTLRDWYGKPPLRIVIDRFGRLPKESHLLDGTFPTLLVTTLKEYPFSPDQTEFLLINETDNLPEKLLAELYQRNIQSLIVEGGPSLLQNFINLKLWDEAHVYTGDIAFGTGVKAPLLKASPLISDRFYNSELRIFKQL